MDLLTKVRRSSNVIYYIMYYEYRATACRDTFLVAQTLLD